MLCSEYRCKYVSFGVFFVDCLCNNLLLQEIHAPILMIRGVKVVVLALFVGLTLASIVSYSH